MAASNGGGGKKLNKKAKALEIMAFAEEHKFIINPKSGYLPTIKNVMALCACPCAIERKYCPCPESLTEVPELGKCKCGLFWRNFTAFKELDPSIKY